MHSKFWQLPAWLCLCGPAWLCLCELTLHAQAPVYATGLPAQSDCELVPAAEAAQINHIVELTWQQLRNRYPDQQLVKRGVHAKDHGCVKAEFRVKEDIPADHRVGVFAEAGKTYDAWVRFSNAATLVLPDDLPSKNGQRVPGSRGMAIKLLGVSGDPLVPPHGAVTQDFLLVNHPVFAFANVEDYEVLSSVLADPANKESPEKFFAIQMGKPGPAAVRAQRTLEIVNKIRAADVASGAFQPQPRSPVDCSYFSGAPFVFGKDAVMKYSAVPLEPSTEPPTNTTDADYLRAALKQRLQAGADSKPVIFEFRVQKRSKDSLNIETDIENSSTDWPEAKYPFVTVATLTILPQDFDAEAHRAICESLFFTPWHGLKDFQPIGGINRLRKAVYEASSGSRHHPKEPASY